MRDVLKELNQVEDMLLDLKFYGKLEYKQYCTILSKLDHIRFLIKERHVVVTAKLPKGVITRDQVEYAIELINEETNTNKWNLPGAVLTMNADYTFKEPSKEALDKAARTERKKRNK